MIKTKCDCCKKRILVSPHHYKKYKHHFCSRSCFINKHPLKKTKPSKEELYKLHWIKQKSIAEIAPIFNVARITINRWMKEYGIKWRNSSQDMKRQFRLEIRDRYKTTQAAHKACKGKPNPRYKKQRLNPTKSEQYFINLCEQLSLPFEYCGNGGTIINGLNPDFVHLTEKKIIETYTGHRASYKKKRIETYKQVGYECIFVNVKSLNISKKIIEKIKNFTQHIIVPVLEKAKP